MENRKKNPLLKGCLIAVGIMITFIVNAQVKFVSENKEDMKLLAENIVSHAKRNYVFDTEKTTSDHSFYILQYVNINDSTDVLPIGIKIYMEGKNADLEIEGTPIYYFSIAKGKFLDLFPFWKNFIEPNADETAVIKRKRSRLKKDNRTFLLEKDNNADNWIIVMNKF